MRPFRAHKSMNNGSRKSKKIQTNIYRLFCSCTTLFLLSTQANIVNTISFGIISIYYLLFCATFVLVLLSCFLHLCIHCFLFGSKHDTHAQCICISVYLLFVVWYDETKKYLKLCRESIDHRFHSIFDIKKVFKLQFNTKKSLPSCKNLWKAWTLHTIDFSVYRRTHVCHKPFDHGSTSWQTSNKKSS